MRRGQHGSGRTRPEGRRNPRLVVLPVVAVLTVAPTVAAVKLWRRWDSAR